MKNINFKILVIFIYLITYINPAFSNEESFQDRNQKKIKEITSILINEYKVDEDYVKNIFKSIKMNKKVLKLMSGAAERTKTWEQYKKIFITDSTVNEGIKYYKKNYEILKKIELQYGVPAEVIVAFLGVETKYGKRTGKIKILDSLATLALEHPRRSKFFTKELIHFIILTYEEDLDYKNLYGSYAGAMGAPQFMPSSYRKLSVDFNKDGKRDLWNNKYDIYASIANYLVANGWKKNGTIFSNIVVKKEFEEILLKRGDSKTISAGKFLKSINLETDQLDKILVNYNKTKEKKKYLILLSSKNKKYKLGYTNFKVIMRYNPSTYYAMCVSQLSKRISEGL